MPLRRRLPAAVFHLGALPRLNELGLLAGLDSAFGENAAEIGTVGCFLVDGPGGSCALPIPRGATPAGIRAALASELGTPGLTVTVPISEGI